MNSEVLLKRIEEIIEDGIENYKVDNSRIVDFTLSMLDSSVFVGLKSISTKCIPKKQSNGIVRDIVEYAIQLYIARQPTKIDCVEKLGFTRQQDQDEMFINAVFTRLEKESGAFVGGCCNPSYEKGTIVTLRGDDDMAVSLGLQQLKGIYWLQCDALIIEDDMQFNYKKYFK